MNTNDRNRSALAGYDKSASDTGAGYHVLIQRERELSGPTDTKWVLVSAKSEEQARSKVARKYPDWEIKEVKAP